MVGERCACRQRNQPDGALNLQSWNKRGGDSSRRNKAVLLCTRKRRAAPSNEHAGCCRSHGTAVHARAVTQKHAAAAAAAGGRHSDLVLPRGAQSRGRRHSAATPATGRCASLYARRCGLYKNYTPENSSLHAKTGADGRTHASKAQAENVPDSYVHYAGDCRRRDSLTCRAPSLGGGSTTSVLCHTEAPYAVAWARRASPSNLEVANRERLISYCCPS